MVNLIDYSDIDIMMDIRKWQMLIMRLKSSNKAIKSSLKVHKPFVMLIYMLVCTGVSPWIVLDLIQ